MAKTVNAAAAATARGTVQTGVGFAVTEFIDAFHIFDMDGRQYAISVLVIGGIFTFIQNQIENHTGKALLKRVPLTNKVPLADNNKAVNN